MFYYRKNGQEIECYFSVYDDDMERMGYCVAIFDMENINKDLFQNWKNIRHITGQYRRMMGLKIGGNRIKWNFKR